VIECISVSIMRKIETRIICYLCLHQLCMQQEGISKEEDMTQNWSSLITRSKYCMKKHLTIQTGWCLGSNSDAFLNNTRARFAVECLYSNKARDWSRTASLGLSAWPIVKSFLAFSIFPILASKTPHTCHANLFLGLACTAFCKLN
jgi:hypothetical protein